MIWLTWRQQRLQTATVLALVVGFAAALLATAHGVHDLGRVPSAFDAVSRTDSDLFYAGIVVVALAPALVGALWGAPLVARELEAGTHRLVWVQGVTRTRWLATKLGATLVGGAIAVGLLSAVVTWWAGPLDGSLGARSGSFPSRMTPVSFAMRGVVPVGYVVFALALGAALGLVLRRTLVAVVMTLAVMALLQVAVPLWVRPHLAPARTENVAITSTDLSTIEQSPSGAVHLDVSASPGAWVLSDRTVDAAGRPSAVPAWFAGCIPAPGAAAPPPSVGARSGLDACIARLSGAGYRQRLVEQPASAFWRLQWTEAGLYLAACAGAVGFALRRVRRVE